MVFNSIGWLLLLAAILIALWFYLAAPDVDPLHLVRQGAMSRIRSPNESAVYRNHVNEHGRPLFGVGTMDKFQLRDMWEPKEFKMSSVASDGTDVLSEEILTVVERYGPALQALCAGSQRNKVLIALGCSATTLNLLFACILYGMEPYFVTHTSLEAIQEAVDVVDPAVVVGPNIIGDLNLKDAVPVGVGKGNDKVASMDAFHTRETVPEKAHSNPGPIAVSFVNGKTIWPVSHNEIGRAIISQMRVLHDQRWGPQDKVLVFSHNLTPYSFLLQLTALSCKAELIFVKEGFLQPFKVLDSTKPTVITTDDLSVRSLVRLADDFSPINMLKQAWAHAWLSRGKLPKAVLQEFDTVRLIHTEAVQDEEYGSLLTSEANTARALLGAQLIHALSLPESFVPIAQTGAGDYRPGDGKTINFGPVLPGIEVKVAGDLAHESEGQLWIRLNQWTETQTKALLKGDGCVYLRAQEDKKSDIYYG